jgi:hypothetical protein
MFCMLLFNFVIYVFFFFFLLLLLLLFLLLLLLLFLLNHSGLNDLHSVEVSDQALRILYSAKHFLTILHC